MESGHWRTTASISEVAVEGSRAGFPTSHDDSQAFRQWVVVGEILVWQGQIRVFPPQRQWSRRHKPQTSHSETIGEVYGGSRRVPRAYSRGDSIRVEVCPRCTSRNASRNSKPVVPRRRSCCGCRAPSARQLEAELTQSELSVSEIVLARDIPRRFGASSAVAGRVGSTGCIRWWANATQDRPKVRQRLTGG